MKRIWVTSFLVIAVIGILAASFLGNSEAQESSSPEEFVKEYLRLVKANDYENVVDLIIDDRFNNDRQTKIAMIEEASTDLKKYEVKEVKDITEDKATVITIVKSKDGSVQQVPVYLIKKDSNWKVHIRNGNVGDDEDFKIIKQPNITQNKQSSSPEEFVKKYLDFGMAKDYESMAKLAIDERAPDLESRIEMYEEVGGDFVLKGYEIKEIKDVTKDKATVVTIQKFENGLIQQVPTHLVKKSGEWKVYISSKGGINEDKDYKMIKPATQF